MLTTICCCTEPDNAAVTTRINDYLKLEPSQQAAVPCDCHVCGNPLLCPVQTCLARLGPGANFCILGHCVRRNICVDNQQDFYDVRVLLEASGACTLKAMIAVMEETKSAVEEHLKIFLKQGAYFTSQIYAKMFRFVHNRRLKPTDVPSAADLRKAIGIINPVFGESFRVGWSKVYPVMRPGFFDEKMKVKTYDSQQRRADVQFLMAHLDMDLYTIRQSMLSASISQQIAEHREKMTPVLNCGLEGPYDAFIAVRDDPECSAVEKAAAKTLWERSFWTAMCTRVLGAPADTTRTWNHLIVERKNPKIPQDTVDGRPAPVTAYDKFVRALEATKEEKMSAYALVGMVPLVEPQLVDYDSRAMTAIVARAVSIIDPSKTSTADEARKIMEISQLCKHVRKSMKFPHKNYRTFAEQDPVFEASVREALGIALNQYYTKRTVDEARGKEPRQPKPLTAKEARIKTLLLRRGEAAEDSDEEEKESDSCEASGGSEVDSHDDSDDSEGPLAPARKVKRK